jgi:hypothetical protein
MKPNEKNLFEKGGIHKMTRKKSRHFNFKLVPMLLITVIAALGFFWQGLSLGQAENSTGPPENVATPTNLIKQANESLSLKMEPEPEPPKTSVDITVNFNGFSGVTVTYYTNGTAAEPPMENLEDSGVFTVEQDTLSNSFIRVSKGGMVYDFENLVPDNGKINLTVPTKIINVYGMASSAYISIGIPGVGYVYSGVSAKVGQSNFFEIFEGSGPFVVKLERTGYHPVYLDVIPAVEHPVNNPGLANWQFYAYAFNCFDQIAVPDGVTNLKIFVYGIEIDVDVTPNANNLITLFKDLKDPKKAFIEFDYAGNKYSDDFWLNGSNPFDLFKCNLTIIVEALFDADTAKFDFIDVAVIKQNGGTLHAAVGFGEDNKKIFKTSIFETHKYTVTAYEPYGYIVEVLPEEIDGGNNRIITITVEENEDAPYFRDILGVNR